MGKTTTVRALFGLLPLRAGAYHVRRLRAQRTIPLRHCACGSRRRPKGASVPDPDSRREPRGDRCGRQARGWTLTAFRVFPRLAERRRTFGDRLSGGEQQMLAIGRALMTNPKLLVLDEATEGLAPLVRVEIWDCLKRFQDEGRSILVIDKNLKALLDFVDRIAVIERGARPGAVPPASFGRSRQLSNAFFMSAAPPRRRFCDLRKEKHGHVTGARYHQGWRGPRQHRLEHSRSDLRAEGRLRSSFRLARDVSPDTFVPPHIHPTQDEFITTFEGQLDLMLDGRTALANPGDLDACLWGCPMRSSTSPAAR